MSLIYRLFFILIFITNVIYADGFNSMCALSAGLLWFVGNNGAIYRSPDGGSTFQNHSLGNVNYNTVTGTGLNLWIGGDNGTLVTSTDAGLDFTQSNIGTNENIMGLSFADQNTGWAACTFGVIYKTTDGGATWVLQNTPTQYDLSSIKFINASNGAACGKHGTVLFTTNGGTNWIFTTTGIINNLLAIDIKNNIIMVSGNDGAVIKSTNFGLSWIPINYNITTKPDIGGLCLTDTATLYSCGIGGFIRKSTNGGASFTYEESPLLMDLNGMYFFNSTTGWAFSSTLNIVLKTYNSGLNWTAPTNVVQTLSWDLKIPLNFYTSSGNVFFQSTWNKKEIFVTKSNTVFRSLDIGNTWSQISTIPYGLVSNSFYISSSDTNTFLVAIDSSDENTGKVMRSTNYGQTWTSTFSGERSSDGIPLAQDPNNPQVMYYGPDNSTLFRSTNFGITWNPVGTKQFGFVCSIIVLNTNSNTIIVGSADYGVQRVSHVTRSTDYGVTWAVVDSNIQIKNSQPPEVPALINPRLTNILYCAQYEGDFGGVKRSFDNGATWGYINLDDAAWSFDVSRDDPNVFMYGAWAGSNEEYITFDHGIHFDDLPVPPNGNSGNFASYYYNRNTLLIQQPLGFYKLHIELSNPIGITPISTQVPKQFSLSQNYPNPFNPTTKIKFSVPLVGNGRDRSVQLTIYNALGQVVAVLVNEKLNPGTYEVNWDAANYPSGVYFYKLEAGSNSETKKMIMLK